MSETFVVTEPLSLELGWPSYQQSMVERWQGNQRCEQLDYIAEEVPVSLIYNNLPHVVMLATPTNLEEFALGFSLTEGIIQSVEELKSVKVINRSKGIEVYCKIPEQRFSCLADKGRNLTGRTGCGLCGATTLDQAIKDSKPVDNDFAVSVEDLLAGFADIKQHQQLNQLTGSVHAAAWFKPGAGILSVREDVGRHNALDKLIGHLKRHKIDLNAGFVVITSRASYEMVQKTASIGITFLAAISAPTGLAIRLAESVGLTLVGFARGDQYVVYSHGQRLNHLYSFSLN